MVEMSVSLQGPIASRQAAVAARQVLSLHMFLLSLSVLLSLQMQGQPPRKEQLGMENDSKRNQRFEEEVTYTRP